MTQAKQKSPFGILGIALVAGAAIFIGLEFLKPASESAQAKEDVLSGAYAARVEVCTLLEDAELPEGLEPPEIGSTQRYLRVVVLFPEVNVIKGAKDEYHLDRVNGSRDDPLTPVHSDLTQEDDGAVLTLTYATDIEFDNARLVHDDIVIVERVTLQ